MTILINTAKIRNDKSDIYWLAYSSVITLFLLVLTGCGSMPIEVDEKLFSVVPSSHSNITFNNEIKDTKEHNIMIYSNYYGGGGVGIGDINNDGLQDIYFGGNLVPDKLYLNKGNLVFEDISTQAGIADDGGWSSGILMIDLNQDGLLDIYVTRELYDDNEGLRKNKLYINNGDNTFTEEGAKYKLDNSERTRHACFFDYDKDGDLDVCLLNQPPNPGDYSPYYGTELLQEQFKPRLLENQNGVFKDVSTEAGFNRPGFPNSVTASDLNGDGWIDLYIANDFWVGDWYYINNGDGTFTDKVLEATGHTSYFSMGVDAADIDNDGNLDIGVVDMVAEDNYRQKANMSGMNPAAFWKVVEDGGHYQYMFNTLQMNQGDGNFSDIAQLANMANTDWSWSILMADFDNDGWKDIHITNGLMRDIRNKDATKKIANEIESKAYTYLQANPNVEMKSIWDIISIEETLALVPSQKLQNYVLQNNGDLSFNRKMEDWGMTQTTFSNGAAYGDLDNDGDLDLVLNNINDLALVYENHSAKKSNYLRVKPIPSVKGDNVLGAKISILLGEGKQFFEITGARGMYSTSEAIAHFGLGEATSIDEVEIIWPDGNRQTIKDVKANQLLEVQYQSITSKDIRHNQKSLLTNITKESKWSYKHEENKFDDYKTQVLLPHKMSSSGPYISKGDVNGDQLEDIFIGGSAGNPGKLLLQDLAGNFEELAQDAFIIDKIHEDIGSCFFDADGDGDLDLYVVSGGNEFLNGTANYQDRLYENNGDGYFTKNEKALPDFYISGSKVLPFDFDKDGDLDLFVAGRHVPWSYPEPASSTLLINESGQFTDETEALAPALKDIGMVNDADWFDYNGDGWEDLVLVGEWMPITVLENNKGQFKKSETSSNEKTAGWWFSVETADMDDDGDLDIIAGNLGLNYKYKASDEEPFEVYYYDFDGNNSKDIVLTYYNFGEQYPLRGKQCSSEQIPSISEDFETYDLFASSNVIDIYGDENLKTALHHKATTFASSYFENIGNGDFKMNKLPNIAQLSSINDIVVDDLDGDGFKDILCAGNLYNSEVETTRNDAGYGLLLLGDGKGNFNPQTKEESGFYVQKNVKSLIQIQSNRERLILAASNSDELQIFRLNE